MKNRSKIDQTSIKTSNANFGSIFIDFWTILGPMLVHLDPSWPQNGAKLAPSWIPGGSWEPPGASRSVPGLSQNPPKTLPKPQVANFDDFSSKNLEILIIFGRSGMDFWSQNTNHTIHQATNHPSLQA